MNVVRLATRNLLRQKRRTGLAGLGAALAVAFLVFLVGIISGFLDVLIERTVHSTTAALQVHRRGYVGADEPLRFSMPMSVRAMIASVPNVAGISPRIHFESLLNNGASASPAIVTAFDPDIEYEVCAARKKTQGLALTGADRDGALLGSELAQALGLKAGATPTLSAALAGGATNAVQVTAIGSVEPALPLQDKTLVLIPLALAQSLLHMRDQVSEFALSVQDFSSLDETKRALENKLGSDFEVHTWRERDKITESALTQMNAVMGFIILVLACLGATGVANTLMMSVSERAREIGTMLAVGTKRRQILGMFLVEAALLGLIAGFLGALLGFFLCAYFADTGISFSSPDSAPMVIFPTCGTQAIVVIIIGAVLTTTSSGLWPAYRASSLSPIDALRQ